MTERIIPIQMEEDGDLFEEETGKEVPNTTIKEEISEKNDDSLNECEESTPESKKTIQIKRLTENKDFEEYLKKYDEFEERNKYSLVSINVPEKIILVVDRAQDEKCTHFVEGNSRYTPMTMLRRCLHIFVKLKNAINKNHEFAIVLLNANNAQWITNFTSDMKKVNTAIDKITLCEVEDTFDMNLVFETILPNINVPVDDIAPPYIIRTIIFYGRSYTLPLIDLSEEVEALLQKPFFICDVLMTHEPVDKSNHCTTIFKHLQNMDKKGISYFFPVGRNARRLHNAMGKLLGHGLQRPIQKFQKI